MREFEALSPAIRDYRLLLDRGYPVKATLKLVGDRYRLAREARTILFRGIADGRKSGLIQERIITALPEEPSLAVDVYNVLYTLVNYRKGRPLFIATDGLLRDAGGLHGRIPDGGALDEALRLLTAALAALKPSRLALYLDAPVSGSGDLASQLRRLCRGAGIAGNLTVEALPSADPAVRSWAGTACITADSAIALKAASPTFDLARRILEDTWGASFPSLALFL